MKAYVCQKKKRFICQSRAESRNSSFEKQWSFGEKDFDHPFKQEIIFTHKVSKVNQSKGRNQTGFSVEWYLEGMEQDVGASDANASQNSWTLDVENVPRYLKLNEYLIKMVNVPYHSTTESIVKAVKDDTLTSIWYSTEK